MAITLKFKKKNPATEVQEKGGAAKAAKKAESSVVKHAQKEAEKEASKVASKVKPQLEGPGHPGLTPQKVTVVRGGDSFTQTYYTKPGEEAKGAEAGSGKPEVDKSGSPTHAQTKAGEVLQKPGEITKKPGETTSTDVGATAKFAKNMDIKEMTALGGDMDKLGKYVTEKGGDADTLAALKNMMCRI